MSCGRARAHAVQRRERLQLLARGQLLEERRRLQLHADPRQQRDLARPRRLAEQPHRRRESGSRRPSMISSVVVLPAPFGPRMPKNSPSATENDTPSTALRSPYALRMSSTTIAAFAVSPTSEKIAEHGPVIAGYDTPWGALIHPQVEPYDHGMLDVGDGNLVYWEQCGNPDGTPAVDLHGGPGPGCTPRHRRWFDPEPVPDRAVRPAQLRAHHAARRRPRRPTCHQHDPAPGRRPGAAAHAPGHRALAGVRRVVRRGPRRWPTPSATPAGLGTGAVRASPPAGRRRSTC